MLRRGSAGSGGSLGRGSLTKLSLGRASTRRLLSALVTAGRTSVACASMGRLTATMLPASIASIMAMVVRPANAVEAIRIRVQSGVLVGTLDSGVESFKGVPYAAPPVGALRWTLPRPVAAWAAERAAD